MRWELLDETDHLRAVACGQQRRCEFRQNLLGLGPLPGAYPEAHTSDGIAFGLRRSPQQLRDFIRMALP
jgi:hypothetical protein